jgi:transcriptional regulator
LTSLFTPRAAGDVAELVRRQTLALVVTRTAGRFFTTPLPLLVETDAAGAVSALIGHFALGNPHAAAAQADPDALILLLGPHGYIPPGWVSQPAWAPTWNYALAAFEVRLVFDPAQNDQVIRDLTKALEGDGPDAWSVDQMGERYTRMLPHVIAFRAEVVATTAKFKLGQDESPQSFGEILAALGDSPLARLMVEQSPEKLG